MRPIKLLIDGYNLLFQSELVGSARGRGWLERARRRLLVALTKGLSASELMTTTIVFDASQSPQKQTDFLFEDQLDVRFANEHPEADDLLEDLIRRAPQPKLLRVVSSDQRVRRCARARRALSVDSESFLRELAANAAQSTLVDELTADRDVAEAPLTPSEVEYWLKKFREP